MKKKDPTAEFPSDDLSLVLSRLGESIAKRSALAETSTEVAAVAHQFPLFPEEVRPVSNDAARSALFSCVQGKDRQTVKDVPIASIDGIDIRFTGERFNQDDHDVLMQIVHMAAQRPFGEYITIPAHSLLKSLGRKTGLSQHLQLRADIIRLRGGTVMLKNRRTKDEFVGGLIDDAKQDGESRYWQIRLNPNMRILFGSANYTLIDWQQRLALRRKDLARWLQLYLSSHAKPFPVKVATLRDLSGSQTAELKRFRQALRQALVDLQTNGDIEEWSIDPKTDLVSVVRGQSLSNSQRRHLARPPSKRKSRQ